MRLFQLRRRGPWSPLGLAEGRGHNTSAFFHPLFSVKDSYVLRRDPEHPEAGKWPEPYLS